MADIEEIKKNWEQFESIIDRLDSDDIKGMINDVWNCNYNRIYGFII